MDINDIDIAVQDDIVNLLTNHLCVAVDVIKKDKCLLPMLLTQGEKDESNKIVSLQPKDGVTDVDKAYDAAVRILKESDFNYALFSYSTKFSSESGNVIDAVKTLVFTKSGVCIEFFALYKIGGLLKKTVTFSEIVLNKITDGVFD